MRRLVRLLVLILVLIAVFMALKDNVAKGVVTRGVRIITGLDMSIGSLKVGVLRPVIIVNDLKLYNPPGYKDRVMAEIPRIYIDYELGSLFFYKTIYIKELRFYMKEFNVIKNEKGELNINSLNIVRDKKQGLQAPKKKPRRGVMIYLLDLKIDKIVFKDYAKGEPPVVKEYNIKVNEKFHSVNDLYALGSVVLSRAIGNTPLEKILKMDFEFLKIGVKQTLGTMSKVVGGAAENAMDTISTFFENLKEGIQDLFRK